MKGNWITVGLLIAGGLVTTIATAALIIYNKISSSVMSYNVQQIDKKGVTIRIFFKIVNSSGVDVEISNQDYDVFVSGNKVAQITSNDRYKLFRGNTSIIPLDVRLLWSDFESAIVPISGQLQVDTLSNLPVFISGNLSVKSGLIGLRKFPVRWRTVAGEFLT